MMQCSVEVKQTFKMPCKVQQEENRKQVINTDINRSECKTAVKAVCKYSSKEVISGVQAPLRFHTHRVLSGSF